MFNLFQFSMSQYIVSLDVGTTTLRAHIYDKDTKIIGRGSCAVRNLTEYIEMFSVNMLISSSLAITYIVIPWCLTATFIPANKTMVLFLEKKCYNNTMILFSGHF